MSKDDPFFAELVKRGWKLQPSSGSSITTKVPFLDIPTDLREFIQSFGSLANARETVWLNSAQNFNCAPHEGFAWNEFELISLAAAENNEIWQRDIRAFWNIHVPILMSVEGHYWYVAYSKHGGEYVQGTEPEFEEVTTVASSFIEFKSWLLSNAT